MTCMTLAESCCIISQFKTQLEYNFQYTSKTLESDLSLQLNCLVSLRRSSLSLLFLERMIFFVWLMSVIRKGEVVWKDCLNQLSLLTLTRRAQESNCINGILSLQKRKMIGISLSILTIYPWKCWLLYYQIYSTFTQQPSLQGHQGAHRPSHQLWSWIKCPKKFWSNFCADTAINYALCWNTYHTITNMD